MDMKWNKVVKDLERLTEQKTEGLKQIFRMARQNKKNKMDITGILSICGKDGQLKVSWKYKSVGRI